MTQPKPPPFAQRRAHPRYEIRLSAEIDLGGGALAAAVTRDLSLGGACVESAHRLEDGADLQLSLFVVVDGIEEASLPPLRVRASVQWTAENEDAPLEARHIAGLKFAPLSEAESAWLSRFASSAA